MMRVVVSKKRSRRDEMAEDHPRKDPVRFRETDAPKCADPKQDLSLWLPLFPQDVLNEIIKHLEASGTIFSFALACKRFNCLMRQCLPLAKLNYSHIKECFRSGFEGLYQWLRNALGAVRPRLDALIGAVCCDKINMVLPYIRNDMKDSNRARMLKAAVDYGSLLVLDRFLQGAGCALWQEVIGLVGCNPSKALFEVLLKYEDAPSHLNESDIIKTLEAGKHFDLVEWLDDKMTVDPDLAARSATDHLNTRHLQWAMARGAQPFPDMYLQWGYAGRLDVIASLDKLNLGMKSRDFDPEDFVHPLAERYAERNQLNFLRSLSLVYGADSLPAWAHLKLQDEMFGKQPHHF